MPNRLAGETSPYLLQHASNPVDWFPWGPDALARATLLDRPVFLSIGYAACHWCHVMERESFEDEATAAYLNSRFIAVKVDREERPDLDQVYMGAVQAMTGQGGWPMSVFLTPEGRPFFGGTYYPDEPRHGMPSFRQVLEGVDRAWREQRAEVESAGQRLVEALVAQSQVAAAPDAPTVATLEAATSAIEASFDVVHGGWGRAPKFPQPMTIEYLLRRHAATGDARPLAIARRSLDAMADGGVRDQLGGGFHRYSTDAEWLAPHFEQMLYDNAQLARVYLHAWAVTDDARYRAVCKGVLGYMTRELRTSDGAFAASQDADTDGVEGKTFVWSNDEVEGILGTDAETFARHYDVTPQGNWEGHTILRRVTPPAGDEAEAELADMRARLLEHRATRPQPARDDKALAAWNGLAIAAFAEAGRLLREPRWIDAAVVAAEAVVAGLVQPDGSVMRSWKDGRAVGQGVLDDHTHLAEGLLALYEATWDERWFTTARALMDRVLARFADPAGGFFDTADDHERLVTRPKDPQDNAVPSGNATAALVLLRLAAWTGEAIYRDAADRAIRTVTPFVTRYPTGFAQWLTAIDLAIGDAVEVAVVGAAGDAATNELLEPVATGFRPLQVLAVSADPDSSAIPLLHGRTAIDARPTAYLCRGFACRLPVTSADALRAQLAEGVDAG
jgi:uncharacterized protein YyaL (SSP411 family)